MTSVVSVLPNNAMKLTRSAWANGRARPLQLIAVLGVARGIVGAESEARVSEIARQHFQGHHVDTLPLHAVPLTVSRCRFTGCSLGARAYRPEARLHLRNIVLRDCAVDSVVVGPAVLEDVTIETLRTTSMLLLPAVAFVRCVVRGRVGRWLHSATALWVEPIDHAVNVAFLRANEVVYASSPPALDITDATFVDFDVRGVPAHLIQINCARQVRVDYRRTASAYEAGRLSGLNAYADGIIRYSLWHRREYPLDFVLVTDPKHRHASEMMELFAALRQHDLLAASTSSRGGDA